MDGINGITGGYSLIVLFCYYFSFLDRETLLGQSSEVETIVSLLKIVLSAALVFCFFISVVGPSALPEMLDLFL